MAETIKVAHDGFEGGFMRIEKGDFDPDKHTPYSEKEGEEGVDATDAAKELAEENGLDLEGVEGTGSDGRILKSDVEAALEE